MRRDNTEQGGHVVTQTNVMTRAGDHKTWRTHVAQAYDDMGHTTTPGRLATRGRRVTTRGGTAEHVGGTAPSQPPRVGGHGTTNEDTCPETQVPRAHTERPHGNQVRVSPTADVGDGMEHRTQRVGRRTQDVAWNVGGRTGVQVPPAMRTPRPWAREATPSPRPAGRSR